MTSPEKVEIRQGDWATLGEAAGEIRRIVFIEEQAVPKDEEWDGRDDACVHLLAYLDDRPVGTARLLPDGHIGRVAVLEAGRGLGIGAQLMRAAIDAAHQAGHREVVLDAQVHALPFYQKLGFEVFGPEFLDAGIPHRSMRLSLAY